MMDSGNGNELTNDRCPVATKLSWLEFSVERLHFLKEIVVPIMLYNSRFQQIIYNIYDHSSIKYSALGVCPL